MAKDDAASKSVERPVFDRIFTTPDVPPSLECATVKALAAAPDRAAALAVDEGDAAPVTVAGLRGLVGSTMDVGRGRRASTSLVLTTRVLVAPGTGPLFGYCDRRHRLVVVSTARLGTSLPLALSRLLNVVAHERGHLDGLRHCATPGCVMQVVGTPEALDERATVPCGRCPTTRSGRTVVAAAGLILLFGVGALAIDRVGQWFAPPPARPFSCLAGPAGDRVFAFNGEPVWSPPEGAAGRPTCSAEAVAALNDLFERLDLQPLSVVPTGTGGAVVRHADLALLEIASTDRVRPTATDLGVRWAGEVDLLLAGKGRRTEVCPSCHLDRPDDMAAARRMSAGR